MKKLIISVVIIAALVGGIVWAWNIQTTPEMAREERKTVNKELKAAKPEEVIPMFEKLVTQKFWRVRFNLSRCPWMFISHETRIAPDYIAQLFEDTFIRFSGTGDMSSVNGEMLKKLIAFSDKVVAICSPAAEKSLKERRLDGYFLTNDFDGAIRELEKGIAGRSAVWCAGTIAKLRAHKAMEKGDNAEVVKQLLEFGKFLASDEMKDFEDCDPTTGIVYSAEWVIARNFMRCAEYSRKAGDEKAAADYTAKAQPFFKIALDKAKDDAKSLEALRKEIK